MARHIVIDGYNLAHALAETRVVVRNDRDRARQILIDLLRRYKKLHPAEITVVFDGREGRGERRQRVAGIDLIYAFAPVSADEEIRSIVKRTKDPGRLLVVSSDREVSGPARRGGAETIASGEFGNRLFAVIERDPGAPEKPASSDVDGWLKLFTGNRPDDE